MLKIRKLILACIALAVAISSVPLVLAAQNDGSIGMTLTPTKARLQIEPDQEYTGVFTVINSGETAFDFFVYAAPYKVSGEDYEPNFTEETRRTQIARWISFEQEEFRAEPGDEVEVEYRIRTPESIPAGGQYAVIFAQTREDQDSEATGITAAKRVGILIYAEAYGETIEEGGLLSNRISLWQTNSLRAEFRVENTGNTDFDAVSRLTVDRLTGRNIYDSGEINYIIMPETIRRAVNEWKDVPYIGLFWVTSEVSVLGEDYTNRRLVLVAPPFVPIMFMIALGAIVVLIVLKVRKGRKYGKKVKRLSRK